MPTPWVPQGSPGILAASASLEIPERLQRPGGSGAGAAPGLYWWHWWGLAARWHGAAAQPGPGREAVVYCGEAGTRKRRSCLHPFPYPEPRSSRAGPRQGGEWLLSLGRELFLPRLVCKGLARAGRGAPNNSWGVCVEPFHPRRAGTRRSCVCSSGTPQMPLPHAAA